MKVLTKSWATSAALLVGGLFALTTAPALASIAGQPADLPGQMSVYDDAGIFSADARKQAQEKMSAAKFNRGLHFTVDTVKVMPAEWKSKYDAAQDKNKVARDWAKTLAVGDRAKGPYVVISMSPGHTEVILDEETTNRGFDQKNTDDLFKIFNDGMIAAGKKKKDGGSAAEVTAIRDAALLRATDYVINDLRGTKVVHTDGTPVKDDAKAASTKKQGGMTVGGWICLGLCVLLGIWLIVGLIRAFSGGGGGGGYGGGGGGGGGGGFMTGLLGGLFGAMAGMWLYNHMFGGSSYYGNDAYASDGGSAASGGADTGDTGAGNYDGGTSAGGGGDYGGDDAGGGGADYGGGNDGGGDYGGGDYGGGDTGGGGDFGGGDGGGGGDF